MKTTMITMETGADASANEMKEKDVVAEAKYAVSSTSSKEGKSVMSKLDTAMASTGNIYVVNFKRFVVDYDFLVAEDLSNKVKVVQTYLS